MEQFLLFLTLLSRCCFILFFPPLFKSKRIEAKLTLLVKRRLRYNKFCPIAQYSAYAPDNDYVGPECGCEDNPCTNGICLPGVDVGDFTCDCGGTGFYGTLCDQPSSFLFLPSFLELEARRRQVNPRFHAGPDLAQMGELQTATGGNWDWEPDSSVPLCLNGWRILCDSEGYVLRLNLRDNGLEGTLPSFSGFSRLQVLDVSNNKIYGTIPTQIAQTNLTHLFPLPQSSLSSSIFLILFLSLRSHLSNNLFTGPIPTEIFSLPNLATMFACLFSQFLVNDGAHSFFLPLVT